MASGSRRLLFPGAFWKFLIATKEERKLAPRFLCMARGKPRTGYPAGSGSSWPASPSRAGLLVTLCGDVSIDATAEGLVGVKRNC
jgi:hypothetical protein